MKCKKIIASSLLSLLLIPNCGLAFSVDFAPGTPIVEALRALGYKANKDIIINGELKGTVALHLEDGSFEKALHYLSVTNNFNYEIDGNTVLVGPQKSMNSVETFKLSHANPKTVAKQMAVLLENDDDVVVNEEAHTITVLGGSNILNRVRSQIKKIDVAQQQINIKVEVIELNRSKGRDIGISWSTDSWSKDTSMAGYQGFKFSLIGKHEETHGKGKVLARPNITTFDGKSAKILMGDRVPVFTSSSSNAVSSDYNVAVEYKDVGVKLEVEPYINDLENGIITVKVKPNISTISDWIESGNNKAPQISERSAETTIRVKSGETILLGGLLKDEELKNLKAVPFLSKIPILGEIFKSRSLSKKTTEIVIAITPTIIYDDKGRPMVETQRTTPTLKDALNGIKGEDSEYNLQDKDSNLNLEENARLKKEIAKLKKEAAKKDAAAKRLNNELEKNNRVLERVLNKQKGMK